MYTDACSLQSFMAPDGITYLPAYTKSSLILSLIKVCSLVPLLHPYGQKNGSAIACTMVDVHVRDNTKYGRIFWFQAAFICLGGG